MCYFVVGRWGVLLLAFDKIRGGPGRHTKLNRSLLTCVKHVKAWGTDFFRFWMVDLPLGGAFFCCFPAGVQ